ncbi:MAG: hypothetical protein ACREVV_05270 [Steroidobacteraceae bacterium]
MNDRSENSFPTYLSLEIEGRLHAGWYRRLPGNRLEVGSKTKLRVVELSQFAIEEQARRILSDLVREEAG